MACKNLQLANLRQQDCTKGHLSLVCNEATGGNTGVRIVHSQPVLDKLANWMPLVEAVLSRAKSDGDVNAVADWMTAPMASSY